MMMVPFCFGYADPEWDQRGSLRKLAFALRVAVDACSLEFMKALLMTFTVALIASAAVADADIFVPFPGVDKAVDESDVVAVVRIEGTDPSWSGSNLMGVYRCYVYQCLKGDWSAGQRVSVSLYDMGVTPQFLHNSTHLVFVQKREGGRYMSCFYENPSFRVPPLGNEKRLSGDTIQTQIKGLLHRSVEYWDGQWQKEKQLMQEISK